MTSLVYSYCNIANGYLNALNKLLWNQMRIYLWQITGLVKEINKDKLWFYSPRGYDVKSIYTMKMNSNKVRHYSTIYFTVILQSFTLMYKRFY